MALLKKGQVSSGYNLDKFVRTFGRKMHGRTPEAVNAIPEFSVIKDSLLQSLKPNTTVQDFLRMHLKANGTDITGQTILRNIGLGKRNDRNLLLIKSAVGHPVVDLSDPDNAMDVLASIPGINLKIIPFVRFNELKIEHSLYSGIASKFLTEALAPYTRIGVSKSKAFNYFILSAGIDRRDHTLEPEQLREVLDSSGYDFGGRLILIKDFIRMRFHSPHLIMNNRNHGFIMGQSILYRYSGERLECTTKNMERVLREAGYLRPDLSSPEAIRKILASAEKQVDWATVRYHEFKYLRFDSYVFKGVGVTWLNQIGDGTAKGMRRLLRKVGIINKTFPNRTNWKR